MGRLLTATMGKIATLLGFDGTNFHAVKVDTDGELQVDVLTTGLPTGAATAAHQVTQNTALQLIDDLRNALETVATDRLRVTGEDQLWSYKSRLVSTNWADISGAGGYAVSAVVPAGEIWCVKNISAFDSTTQTTRHQYALYLSGYSYVFAEIAPVLATDRVTFYHGALWLDAGDIVRVTMTGSLAGDDCHIDMTGYSMSKQA